MLKSFVAVTMAISLGVSGSAAAQAADFDVDAQVKILCAAAKNLKPEIARLSLTSYQKARAQGLDPQQILTIVDYSQPSTEPRLWVFDLKNNQLLYKELVAHAKNSGDNIPTSFSDQPESLKSSVGLFVTGQTYQGQHGYSLRLNGLEKGFNDHAAARNIVVHAANYVSPQFANSHGRLGRSWGCFALNPRITAAIIDTIKAGSLLFAYGPDSNWLKHSTFLA